MKPLRFCLLIFLLGMIKSSFAWVYPEHRQILLLAIQNLSPAYRTRLNQFWSGARLGFENRLTSTVIEPAQGLQPRQLDYASWAAIAGDHSCSPENLLNNVLYTEWVLKVADIAAQLRIDIAADQSKSQRINALRRADIRLQRADADYADRGSANNVHFLIGRPAVNTTLEEYLALSFSERTEINALNVYAKFHCSALQKAAACANETLNEKERASMMLAALADEAFAIHFLQDVFAAGHMAGTWGNTSQRKGTHDYYNEHGLEAVTWEGKRTVHMGDAYMTTADAESAALTVRMSLEQLLDAAEGKLLLKNENVLVNKPGSFNVCQNMKMPAQEYDIRLLQSILIKTPVPGLATGVGELPRFRAEIGKFWGISAAFDGAGLFGGFGKKQTAFGTQGGLEGNVRFGLGLDGILNQSGDGLIFLQLGWRQDAASTNKFLNTGIIEPTNSLSSAIPGRAGYSVRLRAPFWLIPGDLLVAAPILLLTSKGRLKDMAVTSANGGLLGWQSGIATGIGRFQFVLGREVGVTFYGGNSIKDAIIIPLQNDSSYFLQYKSTKIDFPILEYRPFRTFSERQGSSLMVQFNAGLDIPHGIKVIVPQGKPAPDLKSYWYGGVRILFNWRNYF